MMPSVEADERAVREAIACYIRATFEGDVARLRSPFDPSASMHGYLGDRLLKGSPEPYFSDIAAMPPLNSTGAGYDAQITAIAVAGRIAAVTVEEAGFGPFTFVNFFHLIKADGEWKIVSKTFSTR